MKGTKPLPTTLEAAKDYALREFDVDEAYEAIVAMGNPPGDKSTEDTYNRMSRLVGCALKSFRDYGDAGLPTGASSGLLYVEISRNSDGYVIEFGVKKWIGTAYLNEWFHGEGE